MNTVHESSKLRMKAPNEGFALTKRNTLAPSKMATARSMGRLTEDQHNPAMPRNLTLCRIREENDAPVNGANASWEVAANNTTRRPMKENPLLSLISLNREPARRYDAPTRLTTVPDRKSKSRSKYSVGAKYSVGDRVRSECMPEIDTREMKLALMVSKLRVGDAAFVKRSGGSYSYSAVKARGPTSITFRVNALGNTKTIDLLHAGKFVRIVKDEEMEYMRRSVTSVEEEMNGESDESSSEDEGD